MQGRWRGNQSLLAASGCQQPYIAPSPPLQLLYTPLTIHLQQTFCPPAIHIELTITSPSHLNHHEPPHEKLRGSKVCRWRQRHQSYQRSS